MSILRYVKRGSILPNPNRQLSASLPPRSIQECNTRVYEVMDKFTTPNSSKKRGSYSTYSPRDRAIIGNCAAEHGPAAAMRKFKADNSELKESTTRYFRHSYKRDLTNRKRK